VKLTITQFPGNKSSHLRGVEYKCLKTIDRLPFAAWSFGSLPGGLTRSSEFKRFWWDWLRHSF